MTKARSNKPVKTQAKKPCVCDCTDCLFANLVQYEGPREPLLAECLKKPQPYSVRFPYQVEVARAKKLCPFHEHTDEVKPIERRAKVRSIGTTCHVLSQPQTAAV
ncbi:MAG: hypothetical protein IJV60_03335 [Prevotella sp.]|nr:hypothetical protein [Prevotella sp.]MBQ7451568.1 hypothetical protein [Prevotella sp.]MBR1557608.1 hypothetical protein [Prevotella sp.]